MCITLFSNGEMHYCYCSCLFYYQIFWQSSCYYCSWMQMEYFFCRCSCLQIRCFCPGCFASAWRYYLSGCCCVILYLYLFGRCFCLRMNCLYPGCCHFVVSRQMIFWKRFFDLRFLHNIVLRRNAGSDVNMYSCSTPCLYLQPG